VNPARIVRWGDWGPSKLPPILILGFLWILERRPPLGEAMLKIVGALLFAAFAFSFGYLINDLSDRPDDRRAGKPNAMETLDGKQALIWLFALASGGVVVTLAAPAASGLLPVAMLGYATAVAYSAGPRFKERGALGLLASALAQRAIPALFALLLFQDVQIEQSILIFAYTIVGLRWILMHQAIDYQRDRLTGVRTFLSQRDRRLARDLIRRVLFPLEMLALSVWFILAVQRVPGLAVTALAYMAWVLLRRRILGEAAYSWTSYSNAYLGELYTVFLPVSLGILAVAIHPAYLALLALAIGLGGRRFAVNLAYLNRARKDA
jgi:4-hydroxybenzoate polyprenyltransferase